MAIAYPWPVAHDRPDRILDQGKRRQALFEPGGHGRLHVLLDTRAAPPPVADGTQLVLGQPVVPDQIGWP
ncbi:hypothetical protein ACWCQS_40410 [Streptomyces sp. NPDC002076]